VLRRFDGVIAVNEEIVSFLHKVGVRPQRVRCISPYAFPPKDPSADLLPPYLASFLEKHHPVLLSVGLLEPEYDLPLQIETLPLVRQKFSDAGLLLIGSGSLEASLRAKIDASPSAQHILLAGDVPHAATMEAVSRSRLMLRTTLYDGDALSVREALQLGTPVIATDNGMRPPGVRLIPKSDSRALLRAIDEALQHPAERKEQACHDESNLQAVFDFYRDLIETKVG
jgi:glycosyltransferase involved in cell wall biosynthesis